MVISQERDWSTRAVQDGDAQALLELFQGAFDTWPEVEVSVAPIEYLRWKLNSHAEAAGFGAVAAVGPRLVGALTYFVQQVKVGDQVLRARQGFDSCVLPEYRSHGVMSELRRICWDYAMGNADFQFGTAAHRPLSQPAVMRLDARENWKDVVRKIDVLVNPSLLRSASSQAADQHEWVIRKLSRFDERVDSFWIAAATAFDFIVARTMDYLNWRYCDSRAGGFTVMVAEQDEQILGYVAYRMSRGTGHVADLLVLPGRVDVAGELITVALDDLRAAGASSVECWVAKRHPYRELLSASGFTAKRRTVRLAYAGTGAAGSLLDLLGSRKARLHLMSGDTDLI